MGRSANPPHPSRPAHFSPKRSSPVQLRVASCGILQAGNHHQNEFGAVRTAQATAMKLIGTTLFLLAWITCLASWVYGIVEMRRIKKRSPRAFGRGPVLLRFDQPVLSQLRFTTFETASAITIPLSNDVMGFVPRMGSIFNPIEGFRRLILYTGVVSRTGNGATVVVRAPLGLSLFFGAWLAGWLSFAVFFGLFLTCNINGVSYPAGAPECTSSSLIPPLVAVVVIALLVWAIRHRARRHFAEICSHNK